MVLIVYLLCSVSAIFLLPAPFILPTSVGHYPECNQYSSCGCPAAIETRPISTATGTICVYDPKSLCFFFLNHHTAVLVLSALVPTARHNYSKFPPMHTRNRGFPPQTRRHVPISTAFSLPCVLCSWCPKGYRVCTGAPADPRHIHSSSSSVLLTSTLKPSPVNFLNVCISARSKGPGDRGSAV